MGALGVWRSRGTGASVLIRNYWEGPSSGPTHTQARGPEHLIGFIKHTVQVKPPVWPLWPGSPLVGVSYITHTASSQNLYVCNRSQRVHGGAPTGVGDRAGVRAAPHEARLHSKFVGVDNISALCAP